MKQHGNKRKGWLLPSRPDGMTALKQIRLHHNLTSEAAANLAEISTGHYSSLENAQKEVTDITLPKLDKFMAELGYSETVRILVLQ